MVYPRDIFHNTNAIDSELSTLNTRTYFTEGFPKCRQLEVVPGEKLDHQNTCAPHVESDPQGPLSPFWGVYVSD